MEEAQQSLPQESLQPALKPEVKKDKFSKREIGLIIVVALAIIGVTIYAWQTDKNKKSDINSFADCAAAGYPIMESFPEQCAANGQSWSNPDQSIPIENDQNSTDDEADNKDAIIQTILTYCAANGAIDPEAVTSKLETNMQDPDLYINSGGFARLSATCGEGGFRAFLLKTEDGTTTWKIMTMTQEETADCTALDGTGIPVEVATQCYDENGQLRTIE
jgi:hypothetical protein